MIIIFEEVMPEGLLMIAASGMQHLLEIPEIWPKDQSYASTKNCILIDHRTLQNNEIYTKVRLILDNSKPDFENKIATIKLDLPNIKLYIGDNQKNRYKIFDINKDEVTVNIYGRSADEAYEVWVVADAVVSQA